ncbi:aspartate aminotransferase family protein [Puniceicoccales bacterium CK1056]|uniref:Acetylornithine aminotransferase n=1 Tax=Oceanipulchritudo coccoides TaxID=2706888 RepID=A0A6B2M2I9_9BACT|nr:aspartate aminotransferase family protein [Oceanipulchritudo coccoides]NDV62596.1 aspartate aminotransferase family protein [Oceanipulchritudo coccoides]
MSSRTSSKITSKKTAALYDSHVLKNYGPAPFTLVKGEGSMLWDAENRRYLDFSTGIAVNTLGHGHPVWVERVSEQLGKLVHVSNLFNVAQQGQLAQRLCERAGPGKVFFCNSGAEANEFLIKLARLHGRAKSGGEEGHCYKVITAKNAFHGRTFGGMSATPQAKVQDGFGPLLDGFLHAEFNNLESFRSMVDESVAAIMLETIQGEGGIHPATTEFLLGIRELCNEKGILLLIDEVQCGIGRTGRFFAYEHAGIQPDAIGMAKGLGGGFPIGAGWVADAYAGLFTPGSHGTTYGGNPLACTAALAVMDVMEEEQLLEQVTERSVAWHSALKKLVEKHPQHLSGFRGMGYHAALVVNGDPLPWVGRLRENGLLVVRGGTDAIRLMPPLNVSIQDLDTAVEILDLTFGTHT